MNNLITVFTPTYNRANTLMSLYRSLAAQTSHDFEWLIVDDGSTDDTEELVERLKKETTQFPIRYYQQSNGGKHTAINKGVSLARGYLFFIVDSDDYLTKDAIGKVISWERSIVRKEHFAGISGNRGFSETELIGATFEGEFVDASALEREKYNISGDKAEVYYTDVLRKYPFPVFENERFLTESVVWNRMAADHYKIRWFNQIIYITEYREDGLTKRYTQLLSENPRGYALDVVERIKFFHYNRKRKDSEYFNYYLTVKKGGTGYAAAAEYLGIGRLQLLRSILFYYGGVLKRKVTGR